MDALLLAMLATAIAGTGDRPQLLAAALAVRFGTGALLVAAAVAACTAGAIAAALVGAGIATMLGEDALLLFQGLSLLLAGTAMLLPQRALDTLAHWRTPGWLTLLTGLAIVQFGDRSQFIVVAVSARTHSPVMAALGGSIGMTAALLPGLVLGARMGDRLPLPLLRRTGGLLLLASGIGCGLVATGLLG